MLLAVSKLSGLTLEESYQWAPESMFTYTKQGDEEEEEGEGRGNQRRRNRARESGYGNRDALGIEKKGGCCLFLGPDNMRERGPHSSISSSPHPLISHIPPWHVQQTLRTALCALNTNKREAAGYWQADILLPSPVCRTETRQGLGV